MKKFEVIAECNPSYYSEWFMCWTDDVEANSWEEAQAYLDEQCKKAGTDKDIYFESFGPFAREIEE